jgi:hypothetical protein
MQSDEAIAKLGVDTVLAVKKKVRFFPVRRAKPILALAAARPGLAQQLYHYSKMLDEPALRAELSSLHQICRF